jgi:hypothetical protein
MGRVMSDPKGKDVKSIEHLGNRGGFDYSTLPPSAAEFLKAQAHRIRRQTAISIISIGKDLIGAKHYLSHGLFVNWVEAELGIPARTAQAYMQVAHWSEHKSAAVALLPPSVLYLLCSPRTPQELIADVLRRVEVGERVALPAIRRELTRLKAENNRHTVYGPDAVQSQAQLARQNRSVATAPAAALLRAIGILARGLSATDFADVQKILTSATVRQDPALGDNIATAFARWDTIDALDKATESDPGKFHGTDLSPPAANQFGSLSAAE